MDLQKITIGAVIVLGFLIVGSLVAGPIIVDRITDNVIEKLQREYSPGPYAPGFDPDRIDPNRFGNRDQVTPQYWKTSQVEEDVSLLTDRFDFNAWNQQWEDQRR